MTSREVPEWIGKTPDSAIPARVRARVFLAYDGRCYISKRKINPGDLWDCDHVLALINGGENRESNLAPALRDKHRAKTKADVGIKAKTARMREKNLGISPRNKRPWPSRGFNGGPSKRSLRDAGADQ